MMADMMAVSKVVLKAVVLVGWKVEETGDLWAVI